NVGTLAARTGTFSVHISSSTTLQTCGTVNNSATVTADGSLSVTTAQPTPFVVTCPKSSLTKGVRDDTKGQTTFSSATSASPCAPPPLPHALPHQRHRPAHQRRRQRPDPGPPDLQAQQLPPGHLHGERRRHQLARHDGGACGQRHLHVQRHPRHGVPAGDDNA